MAENEKNKIRGKKVNQRQKEDLVTMIEENLTLYHGKFSQDVSEEERRMLWENIATKLNASGDGATKEWEDWRKCWCDLKSRVKAKCQANNVERRKTGGGEPNFKPLTHIEERIAGIIGKTAIDGIAGAAEGGFGPPAADKDKMLQAKKRKLEPAVQEMIVDVVESVEPNEYEEYYFLKDENSEPAEASVAVSEVVIKESKEKSTVGAKKATSSKTTRTLEPPPKNTTTILVDVLKEFSTLEQTKASNEDKKVEVEKTKLKMKQTKLVLLERLVNSQESQALTLRKMSCSLHNHLGVEPETDEEKLNKF